MGLLFEDYRYNVVIAFCFLIKDNKILLINRKNPPNKGEYTVIGGKKERNESISEACKREVFEETGLIVTNIKFVGMANNFKNESDTEYLIFYFRTEDFYGDLKASSEGDIEWCDIKESLEKKNTSEFYKKIAPIVFANLNRPFNALINIDNEGKIQDFKLYDI